MKSYNLTSSFYENTTLFSIPILFVLLLKIFGFDGLYGQDSYEYFRYAKAIQVYFTEGTHPGHYFWPVLYPTVGGLLGFILGNTAFALQITSCLSLSIASVYVLKTIRLLYPKTTFKFLYVFIFFGFCPFLLKMGLIVMSDALALLFVVLSFYYFFNSYYKSQNYSLVLVYATCALMTRYASLFITFPIIIYSLYLIIKNKKIKQLLIAIICSFIITIPFIIFQWEALFEATSNYFLKVWSFNNYYKSSYTTQDGSQNYLVPNLIYTFFVFFHPGFIFIGSLLSLITLKNYKSLFSFHQKTLLLCGVLYMFFLAGIPFQNPRVLGLVFPLILILLFPAFSKLMTKKLIKSYYLAFAILCIGLQLVFFSLTFKSIFTRTIVEKEITLMLEPYQGKTLYSFDLDMALQGRELDFKYKNMYVERYKTFNKNDLILFDPQRYREQWKDRNPMLNWEFIEKNYMLKIIEKHPQGWKLYQIQ